MVVRAQDNNSQLNVYRRSLVKIDSANVVLIRDYNSGTFDLCATLIEVNVSSLTALMWDYRYIIQTSGPKMTLSETKDLLERMIEAARRFALNSPILFRMSTRTRILEATDIRYGVNNEEAFQTFTTSKGIKEIIRMSASYFDSLDPNAPGMDETTQREIRPRFLQMMTLLLSLLNDGDLRNMAEYIQHTVLPPTFGTLSEAHIDTDIWVLVRHRTSEKEHRAPVLQSHPPDINQLESFPPVCYSCYRQPSHRHR